MNIWRKTVGSCTTPNALIVGTRGDSGIQNFQIRSNTLVLEMKTMIESQSILKEDGGSTSLFDRRPALPRNSSYV